MGVNFIGRVLSSLVRSSATGNWGTDKVETWSGYPVRVERFTPPGVDAVPLPGDYVILSQVRRTGGMAAVGYIDQINAGNVTEGEHRIYARGPDGEIIADIYLKFDGEIELTNADSVVTMAPNGTVTVKATKVILDTPLVEATGDIEAAGDVKAGNISLNSHVHGGVTAGGAQTEGPV